MTYNFGPEENLNIIFGNIAVNKYGSLSTLPLEKQLIVQLLCHGAIQLTTWTNGKNLKDTSNNIWTLRYVDENIYQDYEVHIKNGIAVAELTEKVANFLYPVYILSYEGALVAYIQTTDDVYIVQDIDFLRLDECIDSFLKAAFVHKNRFGRRTH